MPSRKEQMPNLKGKAFFRPETVDRENRTVEVVFTTGEEGNRYDWWNDRHYLESLAVSDQAIRADRLNKGLSILDSHNRYAGIGAVLGVTEGWRIEKGQLIGTCRFSQNQQAVFEDVADGILRHVSLGYRIHEYKVTKATKEGQIEKRQAVDWEPLELSIVPVSFETTNGTREAERANTETHEVKLTIDEVDEMPKPVDDKREEGQQAPKPAEEQRNTPAEPQDQNREVDTDQVAAQARAQLQPMLDASRAAGLDDDFAIDAFGRGVDINTFRADVLAEMAKTRKSEAIRSFGEPGLTADGRRDQGETLVRGAEEAIAVRANVSGAVMTDAAREFTGMTLYDIGRELLIANGVNVRGMSRPKVAARAMHSTSDFPLILENVMHKNLQNSYKETPRTFLTLGQKTTVNDFRAKNLYRLGDAPSLLPLGEGGEYKSGTLSEGKEKYAIETFARKIAFTRKMLIDDDMSALDKVPRMFGPAGARLENDVVWGLLLNYDFANNKAANFVMEDGKPLFHADHKNLLTGASSAMSKDSLSAIRKLGRKVKTMDGHFMNVEYNSIVLPEDLETTAEDLLVSAILASKVGDQQLRWKPDMIIEPRLAVVSETAWYAFSNMLDTFEYAYLSGEEEMYTEVNTNTDVDGLEVKVRHDFGAGLADHRGMAKAMGT
ncbi:prohead protease/major capsid protein fusion protein [Marinobacterium stanieri]|uniref:prohead protease/major capsid protein fusion protein n=1 Tax=Marinobacterium stanieri TaxID=49186 RepID=UPI0002558F16|nr:prohead protease/major capsid protein fusion protein [Marinobacterium stanieri]